MCKLWKVLSKVCKSKKRKSVYAVSDGFTPIATQKLVIDAINKLFLESD